MLGHDVHPDPGALQDGPDARGTGTRRRVDVMQDWRCVTPQSFDHAEEAKIRSARRQALLLMVGSCLVSIVALYGAWTLVAYLLRRAT
jgi:hypothetical protein